MRGVEFKCAGTFGAEWPKGCLLSWVEVIQGILLPNNLFGHV